MTAIGIYQPRKRQEVDNLRAMTKGLGVDLTFQVGGFTVGDLPPTRPHLVYHSFEEAWADLVQRGYALVAVELDTHAVPLDKFNHPDNPAYLIGPNTGTIPRDVLDHLGRIVKVPSPDTLNAATAGVIVLYDRYATLTQRGMVA